MKKIFNNSHEDYLKSYWKEKKLLLQETYSGVSEIYFLETYRNSQLSLEEFLHKINEKKPLDYIARTRHFAGFDFYVDKRVLIPRFETELLYEMAMDFLREKKREEKITVAEVGVGSGCLSLSLLASIKDRELDFWCGDICPDALEVFKYNQFKLNHLISKKHHIKAVKSDRLTEAYGEVFDLILSNPPYIKTLKDKKNVHKNTYDHEPHLALFIDDNIYDKWFDDFFKDAYKHLKDHGQFMMEGHEDHLKYLGERALSSDDHWKSVKVKKDLTGRDRFLILEKGEIDGLFRD